MIKGIVIAGNYRQYQEYIQTNNLIKEEYKYCSSPMDLAGIHGARVIYVGTPEANPLFDSLDLIVYLSHNIPRP